jgi:hypothetical protein
MMPLNPHPDEADIHWGEPEKAIMMPRLTTLGRSNLGCTGSNLLSKHLHGGLRQIAQAKRQ